MDILKTILENINSLEREGSHGEITQGIRAVLSHIEIAESHFQRAKKENSGNLFTDVIYRTNHAFEGALKEMYVILTEKDPKNVTTYDIEEYLVKNAIFKERVMELFSNYRTNWRNPSTHDHKLFFTEQEAFLAIVSVSAFVSILTDQIIQKLSYRFERRRIEKRGKDIRASISNFESMSLLDKVAYILQEYSKELQDDLSKIKNSSSAELLGSLSGFLVSVEPNLLIDFEPKTVIDSQNYRPDLMLELNGQKLALDVKRASVSPYFESASLDLVKAQLKSYLDLGETSYGIAYFFPIHSDDGVVVWLSIDKKMKYIYPVDRAAYIALENDIAKYSSAEDADSDSDI